MEARGTEVQGVTVQDQNSNMMYEEWPPTGELYSSFGAESVAHLKALTWINKDPKSALVYTDSMSLHQALNNKSWRCSDN